MAALFRITECGKKMKVTIFKMMAAPTEGKSGQVKR